MTAAQSTGGSRPTLLWGDEGAVGDSPLPVRKPLLPVVPAAALAALAVWSAITWLGNALS